MVEPAGYGGASFFWSGKKHPFSEVSQYPEDSGWTVSLPCSVTGRQERVRTGNANTGVHITGTEVTVTEQSFYPRYYPGRLADVMRLCAVTVIYLVRVKTLLPAAFVTVRVTAYLPGAE
jgi:hypothetical protein